MHMQLSAVNTLFDGDCYVDQKVTLDVRDHRGLLVRKEQRERELGEMGQRGL